MTGLAGRDVLPLLSRSCSSSASSLHLRVRVAEMQCTHRPSYLLQPSSSCDDLRSCDDLSKDDCLAEELQQHVQELEFTVSRDFDDIYGCEADYSIPDSVFNHSSYTIFDETEGFISASYAEGELDSNGEHQPSEGFALPRWNSSCTQQLSSCPGDMFTWKGCQKSAWCDRLDRHPGLCNNKASVPGSGTYDSAGHEQFSDGEVTGAAVDSDGDVTQVPVEGELSGNSSARADNFVGKGEEAENESAWQRGNGINMVKLEHERGVHGPQGMHSVVRHRTRVVPLARSFSYDVGSMFSSDSQDTRGYSVRSSSMSDEGSLQSAWLSPNAVSRGAGRVCDSQLEVVDQVDRFEGKRYIRNDTMLASRRAEDVAFVADKGILGASWPQQIKRQASSVTSTGMRTAFRASTSNLAGLDTSETLVRSSSLSSSSFSSLSPHRNSYVANLLEQIRSKPSYEQSGRCDADGLTSAASPRGKKRSASSMKSPAPNPNGHSCTQCGTQSTPVWRAGPHGPKTLCNACGVRYMKVAKKR